jgi:radical SAM superfamily enzyme YgiQ (UPF0313 family)
MSRNILLINPWIFDFAAYDLWLKPLGLLYLGGLLRRNGHQVRFIDCLDPYHPAMLKSDCVPLQRHSSGHGKFFRQIITKPEALKMIPRNFCRYGILPEIFRNDLNQNKDTDIILITSMMTYWYPGVFEAIQIIKEMLPSVPIVLGGKYATLCYDHAIKYSGADYVVAGAGEKPVLQLLQDLFGEEIAFVPDDDNLDSRPYPAFDLINNVEQLPITTSMGCPYRCSYCSSHIFNNKFRRRNPLKVADEIEHWKNKLNIKHFSFYDDALLVEPEKMIMPLLREIQNRKLSCNFHCPNGLHLREINAELSELMYSSGFKTIRFGFETSDFNRQVQTGGKVKNEELQSAVRHLKNAGYKTDEIGIYLLCGLPGQTSEEVKESIDFVWQCGAKPVLSEYSPIPGTDLWAEAVKVSPFDITSEPLYHNNSLLCCRNDNFTFTDYMELKMSLKNTN